MFNELLTAAIEAIAKLKTRADEIENNYTLLSDELNGFEDSYAKEYALIQKQIDEIYAQIDRLINEAVAKIPVPKDGKDGISPTIDYNIVINELKSPNGTRYRITVNDSGTLITTAI